MKKILLALLCTACVAISLVSCSKEEKVVIVPLTLSWERCYQGSAQMENNSIVYVAMFDSIMKTKDYTVTNHSITVPTTLANQLEYDKNLAVLEMHSYYTTKGYVEANEITDSCYFGMKMTVNIESATTQAYLVYKPQP